MMSLRSDRVETAMLRVTDIHHEQSGAAVARRNRGIHPRKPNLYVAKTLPPFQISDLRGLPA
jgi:hypothetical protein